jgi:hypothetical protein
MESGRVEYSRQVVHCFHLTMNWFKQGSGTIVGGDCEGGTVGTSAIGMRFRGIEGQHVK